LSYMMKVLMSKREIRKVQAFTLMEMMIALTITSIVIIIAIMAYSVINKQFINYQKEGNLVNEVYQCVNTLENDLDKYNLEQFTSYDLTLRNSTLLILPIPFIKLKLILIYI